MGEIKQANFRLDEESVAIFRKYCEEQKINHAKGFSHLLELIKLEQDKGIMPDRKTEIENFESHVNKLVEAYRNSLEINDNAEQRVREQFASDLNRRDREMDELRTKLDKVMAEKEAAETNAASAVAAKDAAEKKEKDAAYQIDALKKSVAEKDQIVCILNSRLTEKEQMLVGYADMMAIKQEHEKKIQELEQELNDAKKDHVNEIKALKKDAEMEQERAVAAKERELSMKAQEAELKAATLLGKLEVLEAQIKELTTEKNKQ